MCCKRTVYLIVLATVVQLWLFAGVQASEPQASKEDPEQAIDAGPEEHSMTLVSFDPWVIEGELMGGLAGYVYNNGSTKRAVDCWELYDKGGNLLAVSWFDSRGIRKTAVDRGILANKDQLEGVFVEIVEGDPA